MKAGKTSFEREYVMQLSRPDEPVRYANLRGVDVSFIACALLPQAGARLQTVIEDSTFASCELHDCAMNNVVLRNVVVDGLDTGEDKSVLASACSRSGRAEGPRRAIADVSYLVGP